MTLKPPRELAFAAFTAAGVLTLSTTVSANVNCGSVGHHWCVWDDWGLSCFAMTQWCDDYCSAYGGSTGFDCGPDLFSTPTYGYCGCSS
jgi:hypothetical protein